MLYDLSKPYDLFSSDSFKYITPHKKATVKNCAGFVEIKYDSKYKLISSGFRLLVSNVPGKRYKVVIEAYLHPSNAKESTEDKDMKAFVYCEWDSNRLIPRTYFFHSGQEKKIELEYEAVSELLYIGVLFFTGHHDYLMEITEFIISLID